MKVNQNSESVTELSFSVVGTENVRRLSGWKKSYRIPEHYNETTNLFAIRCAAVELKTDLDNVYGKLKKAFGFRRRDLEASAADSGTGSIVTPYFNYTVNVSLSPAELGEVIWTRTVDGIKVPQQINTTAFAEVFDDIFDTLQISLPNAVEIEDFIDAVEAANVPGLDIQHDRDATYCELQLDGTVGKVTLTSHNLSIVHNRTKQTQKLIESFEIVRKLFRNCNLTLASFATATPRIVAPSDPKP